MPAVPVYRVFPDWGADPVWAVGGAMNLDDLPISAALREALRAWSDEWVQEADAELAGRKTPREPTSLPRWRRHGQHLAHWLQRELGPGVRVQYEC